jgi:hypothetical protein
MAAARSILHPSGSPSEATGWRESLVCAHQRNSIGMLDLLDAAVPSFDGRALLISIWK